MGAFSDDFDLNVGGQASSPKLVLKHEYDKAWSGFLAEYYRGTVESILGVTPLIKAEDSFVTTEFGSKSI